MLMCAMIDLYLTERVLTYWCFSPGYSMLDLSSMMWPQCYTVVDLSDRAGAVHHAELGNKQHDVAPVLYCG